MAKGQGRASFFESKEDHRMAKVCLPSLVWDLRLELEGAAIPQDSSIREF